MVAEHHTLTQACSPTLACNLCPWPPVGFTQEGAEALADHLATEHHMMECAEPHKADTVRRMLRGIILHG